MPRKPQSRHIRSGCGNASAARATSAPGPSSRGPGKSPITARGRAAAGKRKARDRSASPVRSRKRYRRMRHSDSDDAEFEPDSEEELDDDWDGKRMRTRVVEKNKENVQPAGSAAIHNVKGEAARQLVSKPKSTAKTACPLACPQTFTRSADMERHLLYKHLRPRVLCKYPGHGDVPAALKRPDIVSRHMGKGGARGSCMGPAKFAALVREAQGCEREVLQKFVEIELPCVHEPEVARVVALLGQPDPWPRLLEKLEQYGTVVACKCEKCVEWFGRKARVRGRSRSAEPRASGSNATVEAVRGLTGAISGAEGEVVHTPQPELPRPEFSDSAAEGGLRTVVRGVRRKSLRTRHAKTLIHRQRAQIRNISPQLMDPPRAQTASSMTAAVADDHREGVDVSATAELASQQEADMASEYGQLQPGQVILEEDQLHKDLAWCLGWLPEDTDGTWMLE